MKKKKERSYVFWHTIAACFLVAVMVLSMPLPVQADSQNRSIKVGCFTSSGYHKKNKDGSIAGYGYEYEALLSQYANWDITYVEGNWSELQDMLAKGEIDLLGFLVDTQEREEIYDYADYPSGTSTSCLIAPKENNTYAYDDYEAFEGIRVAYQEKNANNTTFSAWCKRNGINAQLIPYGSYEAVYRAIDEGEVDAGLATSFYDLSDYKIIANIASTDFYYAVTKGNSELFSELNRAVQEVQTYYPNIETSLYEKFYDRSNGRGETFTKEELEYLQTNPTVTVFPAGRGAPFEFQKKESGEYEGFVPDVLQKISSMTGIQFEYKAEGTLAEYVQNTEHKDVITSMTCDPVWAKNANLKITQPFVESTISVITKDGEKDIKTVGMQRENYLINHIKTEHKNWEVVIYDSMEERLDAVYDGKCDATIMNSHEAEYYMASGKYRLLHEVVTSDVTQNISFAVSPESDPRLYEIISKALLMIDADTYNTLMRNNLNYTGDHDLFSLIYTNPIQMLTVLTIIVLLAVIAIALWIYTRSIKKKNRQVIEATQAKNDFFSRMSHDMRTPMNGILGMTALSKGETDIRVLNHNLEQIESSGRYMLSLINDTLDLQKLEAGKMKLEPKPVYAKAFFQSLIEMMAPSAVEKGVIFETENVNVDLDKYVELDSTRIKQIFVNILSNAIKFTSRGGKIQFTAECLGREGQIEHDCFRMTDSGIGMSQEFIQNGLFKPFSQEDTTITSQYSGTGLGLAITRNIIDTMGGSIQVESIQGQGTSFTVLLDFKIVEEPNKVKTTPSPEKAVAESLATLQGKKILLCEDHPVNAEIAKRLLSKVGVETIHAADGKQGLEQFLQSEEYTLDAILMDVRMPNMDGISATKAIRAQNRPDARTIPIIAMTANAFEEDIKKCSQAGMNAHLAKPVEPQNLYKTLITQISSTHQ